MQKEYIIEGMTCNGCVAKVKKSLEALDSVKEAEIQLSLPQAKLNIQHNIPVEVLQKAIGHYQIHEIETEKIENKKEEDLPDKSLTTYKPLLMIVGFIAGVSFWVQYPFNDFSGMLWMRHFMAGFFLVFAFFKLLNIRGFAMSYSMYDILAKKWEGWGYIYPFIELSLGILYLINIAPLFTNIITIVILGVSSIGVVKSNLDKRKIKCACLGDVFNLPMSTVTIVEDLSMVGMALLMIYLM